MRSSRNRAVRRGASIARGLIGRTGAALGSAAHAARSRRSDLELLERSVGADRLRSTVAQLRSGPWHFLVAPDGAERRARALERELPGWTDRVIRDADRIRAGEVRLFSADAVDFRERRGGAARFRWHEDLLRGYRWDTRTYHKLVELPVGEADIKVPWELSRSQHLPALGMAYAATRDASYAAAVLEQVDDWIEHNPRGYGVNWVSAMDVAIRAVNWLWAYHLIAASPPLSDAFVARFLASLRAHGLHIERNVETYHAGITTNHTLADYVGLFYLGSALPQLREATRWRARGASGIEACMRSQVTADGVDFENSIPYHRLVTELFVAAYVLGLRTGYRFSSRFRERLERMLEFVDHYTRPDGLAPLIGDSDDGRVHIFSRYFDWDPRDHRHLLSVGAALFDRSDLGRAALDAPEAWEDALWLLGPSVFAQRATAAAGAQSDPGSRAFPGAGRYVMRHRAHHAVFCADEVGTAGLGNHKHNDIFSFELSVDGTAIVADGGSFAYTGDPRWRDYFRSTAAHSTVSVDGSEQNEPRGIFSLRADASVQVRRWRAVAGYDYVDATHTGFARLDPPVVHRRQFLLAREPFACLVLDSLLADGDHLATSYLQLAPGGRLERRRSTLAVGALELVREALRNEGEAPPEIDVQTDLSASYAIGETRIGLVPLGTDSLRILEGWYAPRFARRVPRDVIALDCQIRGPTTFGFLLHSHAGA